MDFYWFKTDPRWSINKRSNIVILDLAAISLRSTTGHVDTKEGWDIWTNFKDKSFIDADTDWPESWLWCYMPSREGSVEVDKTTSEVIVPKSEPKHEQEKFKRIEKILKGTKVLLKSADADRVTIALYESTLDEIEKIVKQP